MRLIYCRSLTVGGFLIRAGQGFAQWSHTGIVMPSGDVISARAFKGVSAEPFSDFVARYSTWDIVDKYTPSDANGYALAQHAADENWPYDYGALFNFITHKLGRFEEAPAVQCVELVEQCLSIAGRCGDLARFSAPLDTITPHQSYITR